MDLPDAIMKNE